MFTLSLRVIMKSTCFFIQGDVRFVRLQITTTFRQYRRDVRIKRCYQVEFD